MQIFPTRMCNVTAWRHSRLLAHWLMTLVAGGAEGEFPGNCSVSYLSFVYGSTGGVCGRSITARKFLFTGRQTCSLYFVLWLSGAGRFYTLLGHLDWWKKTCLQQKICINFEVNFLFFIYTKCILSTHIFQSFIFENINKSKVLYDNNCYNFQKY